MKKLFVHHPLFRLLSPLFSGVLVYLLILLVNNNVEQLYAQFLSDELYFCIGLTFVIQELSRLLLVIFNRYAKLKGRQFLFLQVMASLIICVIVVTLAIYLYYINISGFMPNTDELLLFNVIFSVVTLIYILLSISYQYLYKINTEKLNEEVIRKQMVEADFLAFKNEINPQLLFDSLETMISLMKDQKEKVDDLIDHLASTYRYVLTNNKRQLVSIEEELSVLKRFIELNNYLPYTKVSMSPKLNSNFLVVPGGLIKMIELIVKGSIVDHNYLDITIDEADEHFTLTYEHKDKIVNAIGMQELEELNRVYQIYAMQSITISDKNGIRALHIPKLKLKS